MNDTPACPSLAERKAVLHRLVDNIGFGSDARAGIGAIFREIEAIRPGSIDRAHAQNIARRMRLETEGLRGGHLPDLSFLDYAGV